MASTSNLGPWTAESPTLTDSSQILAEVRLARSQTDAKATVVRMGPRFGLRVDRDTAEHAHSAHVQHRPDVMFLDGPERRPYNVGPFPMVPPKPHCLRASSILLGMPGQFNPCRRCK